MDTIDLHLNITNALIKTLKQTEVSMKNFNSLLESAAGKFKTVEKSTNVISNNYDDIEKKAGGINKHALIKNLKQNEVSMKNFNSLLESTAGKFKTVEKSTDVINDNYDDIEEKAGGISKHTGMWVNGLRRVRDTVSYILPGAATLFSVAGIVDATRAVLNYDTALRKVALRMTDNIENTQKLRDATHELVQEVGLTGDEAHEMIVEFTKLRIPIENIGRISIATSKFSEITGMTAESSRNMAGEMVRTGKLSINATEGILTSMANMQRAVGLTEGEMEALGQATIENTKWLSGMGKSAAFIEDFHKGTTKLAGAFRQVGIDAQTAVELVDRMLDPAKIEDNALLFAKLGISMQDALTGDIDPATLTDKFKNLSQEMSGMSRIAQSQMAQAMGLNLKQMQQMANMGGDVTENQKDLNTLWEEGLSPQEKIEKTMNKFQDIVRKVIEAPLFKWLPKLFDFLSNKKIWVAGALALGLTLLLVFRRLRKRFALMTDDLKESFTEGVTEGILMGQKKAAKISLRKQPARREGRKLDKLRRVEGSPDAQAMDEMATTFDVLAQSNLFPAVKKMTEHTADWLRQISMGSRPLSRMNELTQKNNSMIMDKLNSAKEEDVILKERIKTTIELRNSEIAELQKRHNVLTDTENLTARQQKEQLMIGKEIDKLTAKRAKSITALATQETRIVRISEKQIRKLAPEQMQQMGEELVNRKNVLNANQASYNQELKTLDLQKVALKQQTDNLSNERDRLAIAIKGGDATAETADALLKINRNLNESQSLYQDVVSRSTDLNQTMSDSRDELNAVTKDMFRLQRATGMTAEAASKIDIPLREGRITRVMKFVGSTFRNAGSNLVENFDKIRQSAKQIGINIVERLKPSNWFKSIREKMRGGTDKEERANRGVMKSLGKTFSGVGKIMGKMAIPLAILGIAMKFLGPVFEQLKPVIQSLIDALKPIAETIIQKLVPPLLRFFQSMIPLLASLVNMLLPPLLKVLGFVLKVVGTLVEVIGGLIKGMGELGRGIESSFRSKGAIRNKVLEDDEIINRYWTEMNKRTRGEFTREMAVERLKDTDDIKGIYKEFGLGPIGKVLDKVGDFVTGFGAELQNTGDKMTELGNYFAANPAIDKEAQKAIMKALGIAADKMETFTFAEGEATPSPTSVGISGGAVYSATGSGFVKTQEAQLSAAESAAQTAEKTSETADATNILVR